MHKGSVIVEKKEKILIVHNYYQIPGGKDTFVGNERRLLQEHGHQVVLYSKNNSEIRYFTLWKKICLPFTLIYSHI